MNESEFAALSAAALNDIEHRLEAIDADIDFESSADGILQISFADGSVMIINRHAAAQEIWLAARAGGFHFRYTAAAWVDTRDGKPLLARLEELISAQLGEKIVLGA